MGNPNRTKASRTATLVRDQNIRCIYDVHIRESARHVHVKCHSYAKVQLCSGCVLAFYRLAKTLFLFLSFSKPFTIFF